MDNLHESIQERIKEQEKKEKLNISIIGIGETVKVITKNSTYFFTKIEGDRFTIIGGKRYETEKTVTIYGSTFNRSMIKLNIIEVGMYLEFYEEDDRRVTTSSIKSFKYLGKIQKKVKYIAKIDKRFKLPDIVLRAEKVEDIIYKEIPKGHILGMKACRDCDKKIHTIATPKIAVAKFVENNPDFRGRLLIYEKKMIRSYLYLIESNKKPKRIFNNEW